MFRFYRNSKIRYIVYDAVEGTGIETILLMMVDDSWLLLREDIRSEGNTPRGEFLGKSDAVQWMLKHGCTHPDCVSFENLEYGVSSAPGNENAVEASEKGALGLQPDVEPPQLILSALQVQILKVLEGKGLRTEALANACGVDKNKFYRKSAVGIKPLQELKDAGLVTLDEKIGYYRKDAAPPAVTRVNRGAK
jgi:hypothetical protein